MRAHVHVHMCKCQLYWSDLLLILCFSFFLVDHVSSTERVFTRKGSFVCSSNAHIHRRRAGPAFVECWFTYPVCHFVPAKVGKWRTACYMRLRRRKCGTTSSHRRWDEAWKTGANRGNNQLHSFSETGCTNDLCCWDFALNKFASVTFTEIITYMHMCTRELGVLLSTVCQNDIWRNYVKCDLHNYWFHTFLNTTYFGYYVCAFE